MSVVQLSNWIDGRPTPPLSGKYLDVTSPSTSKIIAKCPKSNGADVAAAVAAAKRAWPAWKSLTPKSRAAKIRKLHELIEAHADELADLVVAENGKNKAEALASVAKGNETVDWACGLPAIIAGRTMQVSRGVECRDLLEPVGVVACVVPFNFPISRCFETILPPYSRDTARYLRSALDD